MMTPSSTLLLLLSLTVSTVSAKECCLCESCAEVPENKIDMITLNPFNDKDEDGLTCSEMAFLAVKVDEDSEMCDTVRAEYQEACCSEGML